MTTKTGTARVPRNLSYLPGLEVRDGVTIWLSWEPTVVASDHSDSSVELFLEIQEHGHVVATYEFEDMVLQWDELPRVLIDIERSILLAHRIQDGARPDAAYLEQVFDDERLATATWEVEYDSPHLLVTMAFAEIRNRAPLLARIPLKDALRYFRNYPRQ